MPVTPEQVRDKYLSIDPAFAKSPPGLFEGVADSLNAPSVESKLYNLVKHGASYNPASAKVFAHFTGIVLPKTARDTLPVLDAWAGITPADRARMDAEAERALEDKRAAERAQADADRLNDIARDAKAVLVRMRDGRILDGHEWAKAHIDAGGEWVCLDAQKAKDSACKSRGGLHGFMMSDGTFRHSPKNAVTLYITRVLGIAPRKNAWF